MQTFERELVMRLCKWTGYACFACMWDDWFEAALFPEERSHLTESLRTRMCLRPFCKVLCGVLQAHGMHNITVWCCGINHNINVRTATAKITLKHPDANRTEEPRNVWTGPFSNPFVTGFLCVALCTRRFMKTVWRKGMEQKDWELAERLRDGRNEATAALP